MTHKDIYNKFMIEYDKANVTSSYPSLTEYEVATILDKAYNALIAQKITGNNVRRASFESDTKSISDIEPLIRRISRTLSQDSEISNAKKASLPNDMLYFIQAYLKQTTTTTPMDGKTTRDLPVSLVSHEVATRFYASPYNLPWIKKPVCFIENGTIHVIHDPINVPNNDCTIVYIKKPNAFAKKLTVSSMGSDSYFDGNGEDYEFECNSTVAEELISLAIAFALENVESSRLNSKLNMRGLES